MSAVSALVVIISISMVIPASAAVGPTPSAGDGVAVDRSSGDERAADAVPTEAVSVTRADEGIRYDLRFSRPAGADRAWLVVRGSARVVETAGFERVTGSDLTRLRWTGEGSASASVVVRPNASDPAETATTEAWTFTRTPFVELQWVADGSVHQVWPLAERPGNVSAEVGAFGRYALVGATETLTRATPAGRVDLVVPAGAMADAKGERVADALARAARDLDVGDRDDATLAFAAPPSVRWGGESVPARDEFWVNADSRLDTAEAVWLHEYVHTRQSFRLAPEMRWFREASAEYYAAQLAHEQGLIDRSAVEAHLDGDPSTVTLTDSATWAGDDVPQREGARTLAVLDRRIRERTYGQRSLEDVFRRLNRHDGVVTYAAFEQTVAEVTGEPDDAWLGRHVNGSAPVADQYGPDARPLAVALLDRLGVDGAATGSTTGAGGVLTAVRGDGAAFFIVATGFSGVAAIPLYGALRRRERRERATGTALSGSRAT
ncbi:hypothetical protein C475_20567 [Halosimplex carlsbadense 2-9-1]|uniref:Glycyl aminopeptidase n=1 Tax=Halosimplex carlsbadense 2-9-1 TaxID=797114 RepID=M0CAE1_9EURY|nr:hypothetical protein C475_20567 [Halosimplex carlsbadense 2-9-1]